MRDALEDICVVEVGESTSSAYAGKLFADLGAEVIKIERPGVGDPARHEGPYPGDHPDSEASGRFLYLNASKQSVTLDVDTQAGLDLLIDLCADADVVVASSQPTRALARRLDYARLSSKNPALIMASITPFGATGPYRDWRGYDTNTGALGGINYYLGEPDRPMLVPPLLLGEYQAGLNAAVAVLINLLVEVDGQFIDIAEADCWATVQNGLAIVEFIYGGRTFERRGGAVKGGPYPNALFRCKDGVIRVHAVQRREWTRFLDVMGSPEWANDPRFQDRVKMNELYSEELDRYVEAWMADKTKEEIFALCRDAGVPAAPLYRIDEVIAQPGLREFFTEVDHHQVDGLLQAAVPYMLTETPARIRRGAPALGEDTIEVLGRVGVDEQTLSRLREEAVV